jgi:hypothetical protein
MAGSSCAPLAAEGRRPSSVFACVVGVVMLPASRHWVGQAVAASRSTIASVCAAGRTSTGEITSTFTGKLSDVPLTSSIIRPSNAATASPPPAWPSPTAWGDLAPCPHASLALPACEQLVNRPARMRQGPALPHATPHTRQGQRSSPGKRSRPPRQNNDTITTHKKAGGSCKEAARRPVAAGER